jgi:manganese/iron transport system ATP-binding protein
MTDDVERSNGRGHGGLGIVAAAREGVPLLDCRGLVVGYGGTGILPAIDLQLGRGELLAVIGRNGSGKSTWLKTLLGLLRPVAGTARFSRPDVRLTYLAQRQAFDDLYPLRVRDVVAMALDRKGALLFARPRDARERVRDALELVGAGALESRPFRELSEGQKQRVLFARVAAAAPDLAVLDEPTSAMDLVAEREAWELLQRLRQKTQIALIVVSHYVGLAASHADRVVLLDRDTPAVVLGSPQDVFSHAVFRSRYGDSLQSGRTIVS